jgi:hypothetical protein
MAGVRSHHLVLRLGVDASYQFDPVPEEQDEYRRFTYNGVPYCQRPIQDHRGQRLDSQLNHAQQQEAHLDNQAQQEDTSALME